MEKRELQSITITYYANEEGLQRVVCDGTEVDVNGVPEEVRDAWFIASGQITKLALVEDIIASIEENDGDDEEQMFLLSLLASVI